MRGTTHSYIEDATGGESYYLFEGTFEAINLQTTIVVLSDVNQYLVKDSGS